MKISTSTMQIYSIQRPRSPEATPAAKVSRPAEFSQARFAELLSAEEKRFISSNFKAAAPTLPNDSPLGKRLDVIA